jgi:DNA-binding response OmpR family regulator
MRVLAVDDDVDLLDLTGYALRRDGHVVAAAASGCQALERYQAEQPDLVLLDVNLPDVSGFEVCRQIRELGPTPIIMLTARDDEEDILRGLHLGADDYVVKPFSAKELLARMQAVTRRSNAGREPEVRSRVDVGDITLDLESYEVTRGDQRIHLTVLEFRLLYILAINAGRVVSYSRLVEYAWGYDGGDALLLKTHICHIRKKLSLSSDERGLRAIPSIGYCLARA